MKSNIRRYHFIKGAARKTSLRSLVCPRHMAAKHHCWRAQRLLAGLSSYNGKITLNGIIFKIMSRLLQFIWLIALYPDCMVTMMMTWVLLLSAVGQTTSFAEQLVEP